MTRGSNHNESDPLALKRINFARQGRPTRDADPPTRPKPLRRWIRARRPRMAREWVPPDGHPTGSSGDCGQQPPEAAVLRPRDEAGLARYSRDVASHDTGPCFGPRIEPERVGKRECRDAVCETTVVTRQTHRTEGQPHQTGQLTCFLKHLGGVAYGQPPFGLRGRTTTNTNRLKPGKCVGTPVTGFGGTGFDSRQRALSPARPFEDAGPTVRTRHANAVGFRPPSPGNGVKRRERGRAQTDWHRLGCSNTEDGGSIGTPCGPPGEGPREARGRVVRVGARAADLGLFTFNTRCAGLYRGVGS